MDSISFESAVIRGDGGRGSGEKKGSAHMCCTLRPSCMHLILITWTRLHWTLFHSRNMPLINEYWDIKQWFLSFRYNGTPLYSQTTHRKWRPVENTIWWQLVRSMSRVSELESERYSYCWERRGVWRLCKSSCTTQLCCNTNLPFDLTLWIDRFAFYLCEYIQICKKLFFTREMDSLTWPCF